MDNQQFRIVFANVYHCMHFAGEDEKGDLFYGYTPSKYANYFKSLNPDILCLAEAPLDDESGNSGVIKMFSETLQLPHFKTLVNEKSWIVEGKYYGLAILSKYPLNNYESFQLPNPKLEVNKPDGSHWIMHDKGAQKAQVEINGQTLTIFNLHYFPVHHFGRKIDEPEFHNIREALAEYVKSADTEHIVVTGDFNNRAVNINTAFPELFAGNKFVSVALDPQKPDQIDHILITGGIKATNAEVNQYYSDHPLLQADLQI